MMKQYEPVGEPSRMCWFTGQLRSPCHLGSASETLCTWLHTPLSSRDMVVNNSEDFALPVHFFLKRRGLFPSVLMERFWSKGKSTSRSAATFTLPSGGGPPAAFTLST